MPSDNLNYIEQAQSAPRYGTPPVSVGEGTNYVEYGCTVASADYTHSLATLRGGRIHRFGTSPERWYVVDVDPRRDLQLEATATNEIYVVIDESVAAKPVADVVVSTSGAPAALSLHVATIDTASETISERMNRSPEMGTGTNPVPVTPREFTGVSKIPRDVSSLRNDLASGGEVVAPRQGIYTISTPLELADKTSLILREGVEIKIDDEQDITAVENKDTTSGNANVAVIGLGGAIDGNKANNSELTSRAIHFRGVKSPRIERVLIKNFNGSGIYLDKSSDGTSMTNLICSKNRLQGVGQASIKTLGSVRGGTIAGNIVDAESPSTVAAGFEIDSGSQALNICNNVAYRTGGSGFEASHGGYLNNYICNVALETGQNESTGAGHRYDGFHRQQGYVNILGFAAREVAGHGVHIEDHGNYAHLSGIFVRRPSTKGSADSSGIFVDSDATVMGGRSSSAGGGSNPDHNIEVGPNASDVELWGLSSPGDDETANGAVGDAGARTRWDGVIGGGPLGGVDISAVTGASAGDRALTTGASAAGADIIAVFDGADWVYPTRGGTVTPA